MAHMETIKIETNVPKKTGSFRANSIDFVINAMHKTYQILLMKIKELKMVGKTAAKYSIFSHETGRVEMIAKK